MSKELLFNHCKRCKNAHTCPKQSKSPYLYLFLPISNNILTCLCLLSSQGKHLFHMGNGSTYRGQIKKIKLWGIQQCITFSIKLSLIQITLININIANHKNYCIPASHLFAHFADLLFFVLPKLFCATTFVWVKKCFVSR